MNFGCIRRRKKRQGGHRQEHWRNTMSGSSPVAKELSSTDREQQRQEWLQNQDARRVQTDKDFQAGLDRDLHHSQVVSRDEPRAEHKDGKVV
jgi:hypothetical protein